MVSIKGKSLAAMMVLLPMISIGAVPVIYQSSTENVQVIPYNHGVPYIFWSPYTVVVPNLRPSDVIHLTSRAEVTNTFGYTMMVGWYLSTSFSYGSTNNPPYVGMTPVTQDIEGVVHFVPSIDVWATGYSGDTVFALIIYAASGQSNSGYLKLERGYGKIQAVVFKGDA